MYKAQCRSIWFDGGVHSIEAHELLQKYSAYLHTCHEIVLFVFVTPYGMHH